MSRLAGRRVPQFRVDWQSAREGVLPARRWQYRVVHQVPTQSARQQCGSRSPDSGVAHAETDLQLLGRREQFGQATQSPWCWNRVFPSPLVYPEPRAFHWASSSCDLTSLLCGSGRDGTKRTEAPIAAKAISFHRNVRSLANRSLFIPLRQVSALGRTTRYPHQRAYWQCQIRQQCFFLRHYCSKMHGSNRPKFRNLLILLASPDG
jgi:hypothetical protein